MVQVCCLAKSGGIDKRTNKIHKNSNFLNYRSWSKLPGRRRRQSPRCCRTFPRFLHNQQAKMRATTILKWSKLKLNIKTKHSIPLSTGKVLTAINSSPSCAHHQMWDLRLLASFRLLIEFESENSYFPPWTPILRVNMFPPRQFSPTVWRILHNCRRPDRSPDRRPLGVASSSQTLSSQRSWPLLRRPTHGCRFQP